MGITIKGGGPDPAKLVIRLKKGYTPTVGDALYAGQRQRTVILDRTKRGVDARGAAFAPYSTKGPYYYNPNANLRSLYNKRSGSWAADRKERVDDRITKNTKAASKRFLGRISTKAQRKQSDAPRLSKTGLSVVFESYAAFKRWLGRTTVDLYGPRAPHMLQNIIVKAGSYQVKGAETEVGPDAANQPATEMRIGIYGREAARANGHNMGGKNLPQRKFFAVTAADLKARGAEILARMRARVRLS
ncbi:MAG TPA: hypothetical protein VFQ91_19035 [Bryobacteraceae bacterium]|nr:hypothetical protein [Bryobacteraceae bacterium]